LIVGKPATLSNISLAGPARIALGAHISSMKSANEPDLAAAL